MDTFYLRIIASDKIFFEGKCKNVIVPTTDGQMGILAHHENMIIAIEIGEIDLVTAEGEEITAAVSKGFAEVINNRVSILVNAAERPEDIDIKRAEEAKERAQEKLRQKQSIQEYNMSQASLARAITRLKASSHGKKYI